MLAAPSADQKNTSGIFCEARNVIPSSFASFSTRVGQSVFSSLGKFNFIEELDNI